MPLVASLAVVLAALSILAFFGGSFWAFDLAAAFRPQLALLLLISTAVLVLGRWPRTALVIGLVMIINLAPIVPMFLSAPRGTSSDLRILSFNVLADNKNYAEIIEFIRASQADVVILHEASRPWEEALEEAQLGYTISLNRHPDDIFSSMVLGPADAVVESHGFRLRDPRAVSIKLSSGVSVLAIHPLSPQRPSRARLRDQQLQWAGEWVLQQTGPVVVTGDFNASAYSFPYRRLRATTGLNDSIRGFGLGLSYPARLPALLQVSIDHLLHSDHLRVTDRSLGPALGSDHYPLTVDLALES